MNQSNSAGKTYSYDAKGNVTGVKLNGTTVSTLGWDADNRLTSLTNGSNSATYAYNGSGLRSSKTKNGTTKAYLTDGDSPASALLSDGDATYVPGVSERRGSTTNPFHFDLLGSLRAVSNSGGTGTSEATLYEAFGNVVTGDTDWAGQTRHRFDGVDAAWSSCLLNRADVGCQSRIPGASIKSMLRFPGNGSRTKWSKVKMNVEVNSLRIICEKLFTHLEALQIEVIDVRGDYYWNIPHDEIYNPYEQPKHLDIGQLSDNWQELLRLLTPEHQPIGYDFVWLAAILRTVGENSTW